ncbi:hypothetical protein [Treponema sp. Marseille-Q4523]|uniref:hypothetical protein n=1 Tax=Treponema sp. Marseille-Q4523 TaxID=2810610 RepID=UPI0019608316|nr:hypothetical protein [Treponema sp. Marseille-Q4523]MBM7024256.1 hypothetical protein [Treponema sp. Marseille-Q4523]
MVTGFILAEIVFPLSAEQQFILEERHLPAPRLCDKIVNDFMTLGIPAVSLLSGFGIIESIRQFREKKSPFKLFVVSFIHFP